MFEHELRHERNQVVLIQYHFKTLYKLVYGNTTTLADIAVEQPQAAH